MTAHSLARVVKEALAEVGVAPTVTALPKGQPRTTTWIDSEHGFGIHHYASGRHVYFVQTRMSGRMRTVTIGAASVVTRHQATMVARRVTAHALAEARASQDEMIPVMAAAITLLLLTGCRVGEVLGLQWSDISGNRIKLRDSKTGPRTVWLGDEARGVIEGLPRHPKIPWLFWNWRYRRPVHSVHHMWYGIRATANLPGVRLHDLRHTFASHAAMRAETLPMIGRLLGHASIKSTARYAHLDDRHTFEAAERIGGAIERAMGEGAFGIQIHHLE